MDFSWDPMSDAFGCAQFNRYAQKIPINNSSGSEENLCLLVSGFPSSVNSHAVKNLLSGAGEIKLVKTFPDRKHKNCIVALVDPVLDYLVYVNLFKWGFINEGIKIVQHYAAAEGFDLHGYVYAASYKDAVAIVGGFNNFAFGNSALRVTFAIPRQLCLDTGSRNLGNGSGVVQPRFSLTGLTPNLCDVERIGAKPDIGKAEMMEFHMLDLQFKDQWQGCLDEVQQLSEGLDEEFQKNA